jgi:DNA-binding GntR family transcriptional regulator
MKEDDRVSVRNQEELALLDFAPPERLTLNDQVYNELRRLIISGQLRPGQSISIRTLAHVINVSPMPVRGALQRLVTEGALDVRPNRTFALPMLSPEDFREIADLRTLLEGTAAEHACPHLARADVALLKDINRSMFKADRDDWTGYLDLNRQFHFHIYAAAGMPRLLRFIETLWLQIGPLLNLVTNREEMRSGLEAHEAAVNAAAAGDAAGLRAAMTRDIQDAARVIIPGLQRGDFFPTTQSKRKPPPSGSPGSTEKLDRPE